VLVLAAAHRAEIDHGRLNAQPGRRQGRAGSEAAGEGAGGTGAAREGAVSEGVAGEARLRRTIEAGGGERQEGIDQSERVRQAGREGGEGRCDDAQIIRHGGEGRRCEERREEGAQDHDEGGTLGEVRREGRQGRRSIEAIRGAEEPLDHRTRAVGAR
jgi:hypothetical protein